MSSLADRLSLKDAPPPGAAVEVAADHVSAAGLEFRGGRPVVSAHAVESLAAGVLVPSLTALNVRDREAVGAAVGRVLERVGRPRRVGLVVPDPVAKVSLVRFEKVPPRGEDLDQLIRWQVRKAAPFPIEDAQVSHVVGLHAADGQEFIVTLAKREIVEEYESLCAAAGAHAGIVDLSTFNVINAALAGSGAPAGDWLLVNVASDYASIAILRGADLMFFRSRGAETEGTLADLVHQTAMYYEDRLQGAGFSRVMLSGASNASSQHAPDVEQIRRNLEGRLGTSVEPVDVRSAAQLTDRITAAPSLLDTLAPLVGLLLRGRETLV
jgi:Tfp pilus assembly PilM family ATPase